MADALKRAGARGVGVLVAALAVSVCGAEVPEPEGGEGIVEQPVAPAAEQVEAPPLSPLVKRVIDDPVTSDAERARLRVFHGQWEGLDEAALPAEERARLALLRYELDAEELKDEGGEGVDARLRAEAALLRGEPEAALELARGGEGEDMRSLLLRARALEQLGRLPEATAALQPVRAKLAADELGDAAELTAAAEALALLARLEGSSTSNYGTIILALGKARGELDPLHWPAQIAEAQLLVEKDNRKEALDALLEALSLNPKAGVAWHHLGLMSLMGYDFERAGVCVAKLREINEAHPLADMLEARLFLQQRDPAGARAIVENALGRNPRHREWLALLAATEAASYDEAATDATLAKLDALSPGAAHGYLLVGQVLSEMRQYAWSGRMLREAIARQPNWATPHVELGLMLMQDGDLPAARDALSSAARLDPFNRAANNQLRLAEEILGYERIETEHFIFRYRKGVDEVLARDMPEVMEAVYRDITGKFRHEPARKTQIDIMPDERYFGVRITGMPDIWTIAAATGDVISLTPPREGPRQRGPYNWANVLRHEYVHTVTLSQTGNRIPHWFTEAAAVRQETTGRTWDQEQLLAWAYHEDRLFTLETINWGFVRPKTERDRPLAYAQGAWMLEYIEEKHGFDAVLELLELYSQGVDNAEGVRRVIGENEEEFLAGFKAWGGEQVASWGFGKRQASERLTQVLAEEREAASEDELESLLAEHPGHEDLLKLIAERAAKGADHDAAVAAVRAYAAARPADPWSHRTLVKLAAAKGDLAPAIESLEFLDRTDNEGAAWAEQLATLHRAAGRLDAAYDAIVRALLRQPYNATFRTTAATLALQKGDTERALFHLEALPLLEPDRVQHHVRLAALYAKLGRHDDARAAATRARELDARAPVDAFLK